MRRHLFLIGFFAVSLLPIRANLGDTVAQLEARYGKPLGSADASGTNPFGSMVFRSGPYEMVLFILQGKEVGARVSKIDKSAFTEDEIKKLTDGETGAWTSTANGDPTTIEWTRTDLSTALYDKNKQMLMLTMPAMAQALKAANGQK